MNSLCVYSLQCFWTGTPPDPKVPTAIPHKATRTRSPLPPDKIPPRTRSAQGFVGRGSRRQRFGKQPYWYRRVLLNFRNIEHTRYPASRFLGDPRILNFLPHFLCTPWNIGFCGNKQTNPWSSWDKHVYSFTSGFSLHVSCFVFTVAWCCQRFAREFHDSTQIDIGMGKSLLISATP